MRRYLAVLLGFALGAAFFFCAPALAENSLTISWPAVVPAGDASNARMQYALSKMQEKYPGMKVVSVSSEKVPLTCWRRKKGRTSLL